MTRKQPPGAWIKTNGTKMWLDLDALRKGEFRVEEGTEEDQCEGCGSDLANVTGSLVATTYPGPGGYRREVACAECETRFEIEREDGRD